MLLIAFRIGDDRFGIDAGRVVEVLPLVGIKPITGAPAGICGSFNYRGRFVPAVDMTERLVGRPAAQRLSTRVVLAQVIGEGGPTLLGLILENATGTLSIDKRDLVPPALVASGRPWLGAMIVDESGPLQLVELDKILSADARRALVIDPAEVP